VPFMGI